MLYFILFTETVNLSVIALSRTEALVFSCVCFTLYKWDWSLPWDGAPCSVFAYLPFSRPLSPCCRYRSALRNCLPATLVKCSHVFSEFQALPWVIFSDLWEIQVPRDNIYCDSSCLSFLLCSMDIMNMSSHSQYVVLLQHGNFRCCRFADFNRV